MSGKIKVLQVGLGHNPGGIESCILNYHRCIDKTNFKFDYADTYGHGIAHSQEISKLGGHIYTLSNFKKHPLKAAYQIKKIIENGKYDIIHINMLSAANMIPVSMACKCRRENKSKRPAVVVHCHSTSTGSGMIRKILNGFNIHFLRRMNISKWACGELAGKWMWGDVFDRSGIIPNAINTSKFAPNSLYREEVRKTFLFDEKDIVIGFVGRFAEAKNVLFLPDVLLELKKISPRYKMFLIGDGELKEALVSKIEQYGLSNDVVFTGVANDPSKYYSAMDLFVLPSLFEGIPLALLEAQAAKLKCFASSAVSSEANITNTMEYIPLEIGAKRWAERIHDKSRNDIWGSEFPNSYDIYYATRNLEDKYKSLIGY